MSGIGSRTETIPEGADDVVPVFEPGRGHVNGPAARGDGAGQELDRKSVV